MLALQVVTQEPFASVKWFKDNEEIKMTRKRNQRLKTVSQDTHHILAIEKCIGSDRGEYSVSTNTETSNCTVNIKGRINNVNSKTLTTINVLQNILTSLLIDFKTPSLPLRMASWS